ncbi:MFS transporter [Nocardia sp. NPDC059240]|uniref:MFS transporter n=1 Tax=Nocardia sp. NPDC059240 TaxID=3346786 RepID=UPI0036AF1E57
MDLASEQPTRLGPIVQYALLAGPLLSMLDSSIVNVAVTPIARALHADLSVVSWTISGYLLAMGTGLSAVSYLARRFGTLPVYRTALAAFTLASLACALAPTAEVLVGARALQGLSGAPLVPLAMSMLLGGGGGSSDAGDHSDRTRDDGSGDGDRASAGLGGGEISRDSSDLGAGSGTGGSGWGREPSSGGGIGGSGGDRASAGGDSRIGEDGRGRGGVRGGGGGDGRGGVYGGGARGMSPVAGVMLFLGPALGPSLGGALIAGAGWRGIFLINVPVGVLAVLAARWIPERLAPGGTVGVRFDPVGMVLLAGGLTLSLFGIGRAGAAGWAGTATWVPLVCGLALLAAYAGWAARQEHPALDLGLARQQTSRLALLLCASASVITFAAVFLLPVFLQTAQGHSAFAAGVALLPQGIVTGLATALGPRVLTRISVRTTVIGGFAVLAAASVALLAIDAGTPIAVTAGLLALRAAAIGLVITPLLGVMLESVRPDRLADANTLFSIVQRVAASFGVGALASWYATVAVHHGSVEALHRAALVLVGLAAAAAVAALALPAARNSALVDR